MAVTVTNRKVLQLAGSTIEKIKALTGDEAIQERELLLAVDTGELIVGIGGGSYKVIGSGGSDGGSFKATLGTTAEREAAEAVEGTLFFDTDLNTLFIGDGTEWKEAGSAFELPENVLVKIEDATENNVATFTADGGIQDSGFAIDDTANTSKTLWSAEKITQAITDSVNGLTWQAPVKSVVSELPASPAEGDRYLILADETNEAPENAGRIAEYNGTAWVVVDPVDGMAVFAQDTDKQYTYNGAEWVDISAGLKYHAGNGIDITDNVISTKLQENSGLVSTAEGLGMALDGVTLVVNAETGKVEIGTLDFGEF